MTSLKQHINDSSQLVESFLNLIPPMCYFDKEKLDLLRSKSSVKDLVHRHRFNPSMPHTVTDWLLELAKIEKTNAKVAEPPNVLDPEMRKIAAGSIAGHDPRSQLQNKLITLAGKRDEHMRARGGLADRAAARRLASVLKRRMSKMKHRLRVLEQRQASTEPPVANGHPPAAAARVDNPKPVAVVKGVAPKLRSKFDLQTRLNADVLPSSSAIQGKSYKQLLRAAESQQRRLKKLEQTNPAGAAERRSELAWQSAIQKAAGVKVKDDVQLLKKALKKRQKRKQKSQTEWKQRVDHVQESQQKRQEKRQKNIDLRRQQKLDRKAKLARKKGRHIPQS